MRIRLSTISLVLLATACSQPLSTRADQLPPEDPLRSYLGTWQAAFTLDSIRDWSPGSHAWRPASDPAERVTGSLTVRDFVVDPEHQVLAADLTVNFTPLIGHPMSCLPPAGSGLQVTETGDSVTLWFTPGAYDCGLTGIARRAGDSLSGTWEDESIAGPVNRGRFWMRRGAP